MGIYDEIQCDAALPDPWESAGAVFQSHSLYCMMDRFTITKEGRLIYHACRYEFDGNEEVRPGVFRPNCRRIPLEDIDMNYHGDIRMCAFRQGDTYVDYVARFTHGTLEWIKPFADLPETHQSWFYSKD